MQLDSAIINASILTMNEAKPYARAVGFKDGKIALVGKQEAVQEHITAETQVFDLRGATVLPGFIDNHTHFLHTGLSLISVNLVDAGDSTQVLRRIRMAARYQPIGTLIRGYGYDEQNYPDKTPPNRKQLDAVAPEHLVWLNRVDYHSSIVNSPLLELLQLPEDIAGVDRDDNDQPTGLLRADADQAARSFIANRLSQQVRRKALEKAAQFAIQEGITTVCALEGGEDFGAEEVKMLLEEKKEVNLRIEVFYQTINVEEVLELGLPRIGGCIIVDGSFGSRTAALSCPYADDPDNMGLLYFSQAELNDFIYRAHKAGLQAAVHAIGDRAIEQVITAHEQAQRRFPRVDARHRIEHFELPTLEQIRRAGALGLIPSMQPSFELYWGGADNLYGLCLGEDRVNKTNPLRDIIKAGLLVCGGSDASVTPMNPMYGVHGAVNHPNPMQQLSVVDSLRMFTINGAYALGLEKERGSIEPGKEADLVVLEENPLRVLPQRLKDIEVRMTFIAGKLIYSNPAWGEGVL